MSIEGVVIFVLLGAWFAWRFSVARRNELNKPQSARSVMSPSGIVNADPKVFERPIIHIPQPHDDLQQVVLCNDDQTPMDFVVNILTTVFGFSIPQACRLMAIAHNYDTAVVAILEPTIAQQKVAEAQAQSTAANLPLRFNIEPWTGEEPDYITIQ